LDLTQSIASEKYGLMLVVQKTGKVTAMKIFGCVLICSISVVSS